MASLDADIVRSSEGDAAGDDDPKLLSALTDDRSRLRLRVLLPLEPLLKIFRRPEGSSLASSAANGRRM